MILETPEASSELLTVTTQILHFLHLLSLQFESIISGLKSGMAILIIIT